MIASLACRTDHTLGAAARLSAAAAHGVRVTGAPEILRKEGTFRNLDAQTRNAETQFGPHAED